MQRNLDVEREPCSYPSRWGRDLSLETTPSADQEAKEQALEAPLKNSAPGVCWNVGGGVPTRAAGGHLAEQKILSVLSLDYGPWGVAGTFTFGARQDVQELGRVREWRDDPAPPERQREWVVRGKLLELTQAAADSRCPPRESPAV